MIATAHGLVHAAAPTAAPLPRCQSLRTAVQTAEIKTVVTSRRFIETAKLEDVENALANTKAAHGSDVQFIYLENVRRELIALDKVRGFMRSLSPLRFQRRIRVSPDDPAVILFTSGIEGLPKGVVLSNRNLVGNARQIAAHAKDAWAPHDVVMNPLPMFHSFGLTAAVLLPIFSGMKTVLYPSPLHYKQVPALISATGASILLATDTFLQGYARAAEEEQLSGVRVVVCGAERVKEQTRDLWRKWGTIILEGYGATECAPVIAWNLPHNNTSGTVGALLPGIEARPDPVSGIAEGGRLIVRGPNVVLGYMRPVAPGVTEPPDGGWHDTGDIVQIDSQGMVAIKGRAKRFAKIGGEMLSLAAVETMVAELWPDANHVVVSLPDARKGEQLVLVTDKSDADKGVLLAGAKAQGFSELWVPKAILVVAQIPLLGSGKVDLPATIEVARKTRPLL